MTHCTPIHTFQHVVNFASTLEREIKEVERSLRSLRDEVQGWEKDIEKDERVSVKLLLAALTERRERLKEFLATPIQAPITESWRMG